MTIFSSPLTRFAPTLLGGGKSKAIGNGCSAVNGLVTFVVAARRLCDVVPRLWLTHTSLLLQRGGEAFG